jgi:tetratricopeptide (TPR) repeat protein
MRFILGIAGTVSKYVSGTPLYPRFGAPLFVLAIALFPASQGHACSWDLNGVGYPPECGYRGGRGTVQQQPYVPSAAKQADNLNSAGVAASNARDFARAASLFQQALQIYPNFGPAMINLRNTRAILANEEGVKAFKAGNAALAVRYFEQALRINPNDAMAASNLRQARAQLGNSAPAAGQPNLNVANNSTSARSLNDQGIASGRAHNWPLAVSLFEQALRLQPNDRVIAKNLRQSRAMVSNVEGNKAFSAGDYAAAAKLYELALRTDPTNPDLKVIADNLKQARARIEAARVAAIEEARAAAAAKVRAAAEEKARIEAQKVALAKQQEDEAKAQQEDARKQQAKKDEEEKQRQLDAQKKLIGAAEPSTPANNIKDEWTCPPALPKLVVNPSRFNQPDGHYCIASNSVACSGPTKSWACAAGKNCNGDGSDPNVDLCR